MPITPLTEQSLFTLLRIAALEETELLPSTWRPNGHSLNALRARGLAFGFGLTPAGRQLAAQLRAFSRLDPAIREDYVERIRKVFSDDDELLRR